MEGIPTKETLIDSTVGCLCNIPAHMRRDYVTALLTCIALETGEDLCDSMRLLHEAMVEINKLFDYSPPMSQAGYEAMVN